MNQSAKQRYAALKLARETVLDRARQAASLTIPGMIPDEGQDEHFVSEQPWQSQGAHGVKMLTSRMVMTLFPPNQVFFRLAADPATAKKENANPEEANLILSEMAGTVHTLMEASNMRQSLSMTVSHLIVAGNFLLHQPERGRPRGYRIDQYVVRRNSQGDFMVIIIEEQKWPSELSEEVRLACQVKQEPNDKEKPLPVYTVVERQGDKVVQWQEINDIEVPESRGESPAEFTGWIPLRWEEVPGSDYGRSMVTLYAGDLLTMESHAKAMAEIAAIAAKITFLVDASSQTDIEELAQAPNGSFVHGSGDDVTTVQIDKQSDFSITKSHYDGLERRITSAFMIRDFRDAERVTQEEIRAQAEELEIALGGTYSLLSNELQRPLIQRWLWLAEKQKKIAGMSKTKDAWAIKLVTGMDALGRASEATRIRNWLADVIQIPGVAETLNGGQIANRLGLSHGVEDLASLIKSPEQQAAEAEQAQAQQTATAVMPQIAKGAIDQMNQNGM